MVSLLIIHISPHFSMHNNTLAVYSIFFDLSFCNALSSVRESKRALRNERRKNSVAHPTDWPLHWQNTSVSGMSHATDTPIVSPPRYRSPSQGDVSWDGRRWVGNGMDDKDEEDRREEEDNEREEDGDDSQADVFHQHNVSWNEYMLDTCVACAICAHRMVWILCYKRISNTEESLVSIQVSIQFNDAYLVCKCVHIGCNNIQWNYHKMCCIQSMVSNVSDDIFVRPAPPLLSTPKSAHGRRNDSVGPATRRYSTLDNIQAIGLGIIFLCSWCWIWTYQVSRNGPVQCDPDDECDEKLSTVYSISIFMSCFLQDAIWFGRDGWHGKIGEKGIGDFNEWFLLYFFFIAVI